MADDWSPEVGEVLPDLRETRGGPRHLGDIEKHYQTAKQHPGKWICVSRDDGQNSARNWIKRKYPDLRVSTRTLSHNTEGRVTVFIRWDEGEVT
jgi:hypothetical protein